VLKRPFWRYRQSFEEILENVSQRNIALTGPTVTMVRPLVWGGGADTRIRKPVRREVANAVNKQRWKANKCWSSSLNIDH
jgi:hypothetical protein